MRARLYDGIYRTGIIVSLSVALTACGGGGGGDGTGSVPTGQTGNTAPVVSQANLDQVAEVGAAFSHDASQGGTTFSDADGDTLNYVVTLQPAVPGLVINGSVISGVPGQALDSTATITATDPSGASASDVFTIFIDENQDVIARSGVAGLRFFVGQPVDFEAVDWLSEFTDPSNAGLTLRLELDGNIPGLTATATSLIGSPTTPGTHIARIIAENGVGAPAVRDIRIAILRSTTSGAPVLPASPADYVGYAEDDLPLHFRDPAQGAGSVIAADNTPGNNPLTNSGVTLGRVLFYDTRLSVNNTVSCASCHVQAFGFSEPSRFSRGFDGAFTDRNAPQLSNVRFYQNGHMFWDERADTLEVQALGPIQSSIEMGNTLANLVSTVATQAFYPPLFEAAFGDDAVTSERIARALAQFQRAIVSYQSRLDDALIGDDPDVNQPDFAGRLSAAELRGMAMFEPVDDQILAAAGQGPVQSMGCDQCHQTAVQILSTAPGGGRGPQNIGLDPAVIGVGATGIDDFKVPSLRNVGVTAPFMHDGRFDSLEDVVRFYAEDVNDNGATSRFLRQGNQANGAIRRFNLDDGEVADLVAFLNALTDEAILSDARFSDPFAE